jgi:hypothetical protein
MRPKDGLVLNYYGPSTVQVPTSAGQTLMLTRNRIGNGTAYVFIGSESALIEKPDVLHYIWKEAIGQPLWEAEVNPERYLVRVRRQNQRYIIHVIDNLTRKEGQMSEAYNTQRYRPLYTKLAINSDFVPFTKATVVPDNRPLQISSDGIWKTVEIYPDPELTITVE